MDFLMTGGAGCAAADHCPGQTEDEYKTEFVLWSLTQSPMIVDTDVRNMTLVMRRALLNPELNPCEVDAPGCEDGMGEIVGVTILVEDPSQILGHDVVTLAEAADDGGGSDSDSFETVVSVGR